MECQWGRFVWWLGRNAAAVQALAAVATVALTGVLIAVTIRYVSLTRKMLEASEAAVRSGFLPDIDARIDFTEPRRDELSVFIRNAGESPIRVSRAKLVGGSVLKRADPQTQPFQFKSETKFGAHGELTALTSLFLRKNEAGNAAVQIVPSQPMDQREWLKVLDYKVSLIATAVIEVSDISGRVLYSFTVLRNDQTSGTKIQTRCPSGYDSV